MFKEFMAFVKRGNVLDLAVAVIIGAAFGAIVKSLVDDIVMPPIGLLLGSVNFADLFIDLSGQGYTTLAAAKGAGGAAPPATINYGVFLNTVINFVIIAFVVFLVVRSANRAKKAEVAAGGAAPSAALHRRRPRPRKNCSPKSVIC